MSLVGWAAQCQYHALHLTVKKDNFYVFLYLISLVGASFLTTLYGLYIAEDLDFGFRICFLFWETFIV